MDEILDNIFITFYPTFRLINKNLAHWLKIRNFLIQNRTQIELINRFVPL